MSIRYDAIVIGAGLGGLTAAARLARGAASAYNVGDLVVEASLHETTDPRDPADPKHEVLAQLGVLDAVEWVPVGALYEVKGGPVGAPFLLPDGFVAARRALGERFPEAGGGIGRMLGDMERISAGLGMLNRGRDGSRDLLQAISAVIKLWPMVRDWRLSLDDVFNRHFGANEAVKCALAANLPYYHDDPGRLWAVFFSVAQGGFLQSGGYYIRGGSQRLSDALAAVVTAAGGDILLGRTATAIHLDADGAPTAVRHDDGLSGDAAEAEGPIVLGNAAPGVLAGMLPEAAGARFFAPYARRPQSISLFSVTFGLSVRPAEFGIKAYSNFLLPDWMMALANVRRSALVMHSLPADEMPVMVAVAYSRIDSGLGGPPYPVAVVGPDLVGNWPELDQVAYADKRKRWSDAIVSAIDREFPGFADAVVASEFNTARSLAKYLNAPAGAIYGFAPSPPAGPIWRGIDRSPKTAIPGLFLASSYAGAGGFTGAINAGASAANLVIAQKMSRRRLSSDRPRRPARPTEMHRPEEKRPCAL